MDKKSALRILGLSPSAGREEAKKAFRSLAKSFHPDRFARDPVGAKTAEARMKEINLAFHFLVPLLPVAPEPVQFQESNAEKGPGFFSSVRKKWKNRPRPKPGPAGSTGGAPRPKRPVSMKPKGRNEGLPRFETLLNALDPDRKTPPLRTPKPVRPYENYCRYMAVKKKIKGASIRSKNMGTGQVEKISPISRVNPIGGD